jgi:hypothetical protein
MENLKRKIMFKRAFFKFLSWLIPSEKDFVKNKYIILQLLFTCEHQSITSKESIELFESVKKEFDSELEKRELHHKTEMESIQTYFKRESFNPFQKSV